MSATPHGRAAQAPVDDWFLARWSPRSFASEPLTDEQIATLFEAARWAPSCYNEQPWLFVYGATDADRARVAECLVDANRVWAERAPLLGVVFARRSFAKTGKPNRWAPFDSGAASFSLALQATKIGLAAHFMGGFSQEKAHELLGVPAGEYEAMAAFAVGRPGPADALPEGYRERETPSDRKPLAQVAVAGTFGAR